MPNKRCSNTSPSGVVSMINSGLYTYGGVNCCKNLCNFYNGVKFTAKARDKNNNKVNQIYVPESSFNAAQKLIKEGLTKKKEIVQAPLKQNTENVISVAKDIPLMLKTIDRKLNESPAPAEINNNTKSISQEKTNYTNYLVFAGIGIGLYFILK